MSSPGIEPLPPGTPLEELLGRGLPMVPLYLSHLPSSTDRFRSTVLLGVLAHGPAVVEVVRERLRRRDSPEKWALLRGLGEVGHPEAEGYFVRVLRERHSVDASICALQALGTIRGGRSLGVVEDCLADGNLFAAACAALGRLGSPEAEAVLERRVGELPAFAALAARGAACARDAFVVGLEREPEWAAAAALGIGRLGDPELAAMLLPHLGNRNAAVRKAAFEAYAQLAGPQGGAPLLEVARRDPQAWMIPALGQVEDEAVSRHLLEVLAGPPRRGLLRRLFSRGKSSREAERRAAARALRDTFDPVVLKRIGVLLTEEHDPVVVRHLLAVRGLLPSDPQRDRVGELWRRGDLAISHAAGVALLQNPDRQYLGEVLEFIGRPGFCEQDGAPVGADPQHLMESYASDNNPALLLGSFVDSGFLDLAHLASALAARLAAWSFPSDTPPLERFRGPGDGDVGPFLQTVGVAHPGEKECLWRIWDLLSQLEAQGDSLLDLFLSHTGAHRGGLQRCLFAGFPSAVAKFLDGKGDRDLPELDAIAAHLPGEGAMAGPLRGVLERARTALKIECRDIALVVEGTTRGDVVLIEKL